MSVLFLILFPTFFPRYEKVLLSCKKFSLMQLNVMTQDIRFSNKCPLHGKQSGAVEACWAHNPEVRGSKPRSANFTLFFFYHFTCNEKYKLFEVRICDFSLASSKCNDVGYIFFFKPWITFFKLLLTWPSIITEKNVNQKYVCVLSESWWHLLPIFVCLFVCLFVY